MSVLDDLAATIADMAPGRRLLVGVDGPDASGKSILANHLAYALTVPLLRASIDGFHRRREFRMARGIDSPEGYYRDSFDLEALEDALLGPFARGESTVQTRVFDFLNDREVDQDYADVPPACVLIFDGVFILRPELRRWWDLSVYLDVAETVTLERAAVRDAALYGSKEETEARFRARYLPGQALYRQESRPKDAAHVVLDNTNPEAPSIVRWDIAARV